MADAIVPSATAQKRTLMAFQGEGADYSLRALFAPLDGLLASGGDDRLSLDRAFRLNGYGCSPSPRSNAITFASTTATSISERAYTRADCARHELIEASLASGLEAAFDQRIEQMRRELKTYLGLGASEAEIVFSPSGTDSQLHALFVARSLFGSHIVSVIAASDETGSGTVFSTAGRHFNAQTTQGTEVEKKGPIAGLATDAASIAIPLRDGQGNVRSAEEVDQAILDAIAAATTAGNHVILHVMDCSKLGARSPSQHCIDEVCARWPDNVQIVVDACQARLGRKRIGHYLRRGFIVLLTGSKFFTGAPFSGALLVPERLSERLTRVADVPAGLCDYTNQSDWPARFAGIRSRLPARMNFGQWLRWEAALEEIRSYFSVPPAFRSAALNIFSATVLQLIAGSPSLELMPGRAPDSSDAHDDDEMSIRTIWPFTLRRAGKTLSPEACAIIYRALNKDVSGLLPATASARDRRIASQLCHIGQPVALKDGEGGSIAALRISAGARIVSESWSLDENLAHRNLQRELDQVAIIIEKLETLIAYFDVIGVSEDNPKWH